MAPATPADLEAAWTRFPGDEGLWAAAGTGTAIRNMGHPASRYFSRCRTFPVSVRFR